VTRREATREACAIFGLVYHSIGDYTYSSDGFCDRCPQGEGRREGYYRNHGKIFDYVRQAVLEKLKRDSIAVADGFDPQTGMELFSTDRARLRAHAGGRKVRNDE